MSEGLSPSLFLKISNPQIEYNIAIKQPKGLEVKKFFPPRSESWKNFQSDEEFGKMERFSVKKVRRVTVRNQLVNSSIVILF